MKKILYLVMFAFCMLPMIVFADEVRPNNRFGALTGDIYSNHSVLSVSDEPSAETVFEVKNNTKITGIWTYHWNVSNYNGGTIKLINIDTNIEYGPWNVEADEGSGRNNVNWYVFPNVEIPAGKYKLIDSDNETWSYASDTANKGIAAVKGIQYIGDVALDGSTIKPVVGNTPNNLSLSTPANYDIEYQSWINGEGGTYASTFLEGKPYLYTMYLRPKAGFEFKNGDNITISNIFWDHPEIEFITEGPNEGCLLFIGVTYANSTVYNFLEGSDLKEKNINKFIFRIDADINNFGDNSKVFVGTNEVPKSQYTVVSGSTIITLSPEYVRELPIGEELTLKVLFEDGGVALTHFTRLSNSIPEDENPDNLGDTTSEINNPQTGDNIVLYLVIGLMSVFGIAGAIIYIRKFNFGCK